MLNVSVRPSVEGRLAHLDDAWERDLLDCLPFPLAYALNRVRQEEVPWDVLLKDTLTALLRYLALVGVSRYLSAGEEPDYDVNDELKKLARPMSDGEWWKLARACALHKTAKEALPELAEAVRRLDRDKELRVSLQWDRYGIRSQRLPPVEALVYARNRLYAHGVTPEASEKAEASTQVRQVFRLVLDELQDLWSCELCVPLPEAKMPQHYLLKGIEGFAAITAPASMSGEQAFLRLPSGEPLLLHPLTLGGPAESAASGSLLDETAEIYLLNQIKLRKTTTPVFLGVSGSQPERPDLSEHFDALLNGKNVWATRQDIQLDRVLQYTARKSRDSLDYFEWNNLYDPFRYVERPAVEELIEQFLADETSRMLFIAGESGSGKTATSMHMAHRLLDRNVPVCVVRAAEMPSRVAGGEHRLAAWLCAYHGYAGTFDEILSRAAAPEAGRFVVIIDGLNEFLAAGRDLDGLWRSINGLVEAYASHASLKVVLTTRTEGEALNIYFPNHRPPEFADHGLFYLMDNKPWLLMPGFTTEETASALRAYGLDDETTKQAQQMHGKALSNPNLVSRYAEGVLSGDDVKKISRHGVTVRFVERRLGGHKALRKTLDRLVAVLSKSRTLEMTFDEIAKRDAGLAATLQANNYRALHRLRELGLVALQRREDEAGNLTSYVALRDDPLFERLAFNRLAKKQAKSGCLWIAIPALLVGLLFLGLRFYRPTSQAPSANESQALRGFFENAQERSATNARPHLHLASLRTQATALLEKTCEVRHAMFGPCLRFYACHLAFYCVAFMGILTVLALISTWLAARRMGDPRIKYASAIAGLGAARTLSRTVQGIAVLAVLVTVANLAVHHEAWLNPERAFTDAVVLLLPLLVLGGIAALLGPPYMFLVGHRYALRSGSGVLRYWWYSKEGVLHNALAIARMILAFIAVFALVCLWLWVPLTHFPWYEQTLQVFVSEARTLSLEWSRLAQEVGAIAGGELPQEIPTGRELLFLEGTLFDPDSTYAFCGLLALAVGLFIIGGFATIVMHAYFSRRFFPEDWGLKKAGSSNADLNYRTTTKHHEAGPR